MSKKTTPNRIRELREAARLSQEELGTLVGVHFTTVARHERGNRSLTDDMVIKYARVFKCQTHEVFINLSEGSEATVSTVAES